MQLVISNSDNAANPQSASKRPYSWLELGYPDTTDKNTPSNASPPTSPEILQELNEALDGRCGAKMWAVNTETGEQSTGLELTSPPVWDSITVAQGRVYVSTMDGRVQCFGK